MSMPQDIVRNTARKANVAPWVLFEKYADGVPSLASHMYANWFNNGIVPKGMTDYLLIQHWSKIKVGVK